MNRLESLGVKLVGTKRSIRFLSTIAARILYVTYYPEKISLSRGDEGKVREVDAWAPDPAGEQFIFFGEGKFPVGEANERLFHLVVKLIVENSAG